MSSAKMPPSERWRSCQWSPRWLTSPGGSSGLGGPPQSGSPFCRAGSDSQCIVSSRFHPIEKYILIIPTAYGYTCPNSSALTSICFLSLFIITPPFLLYLFFYLIASSSSSSTSSSSSSSFTYYLFIFCLNFFWFLYDWFIFFGFLISWLLLYLLSGLGFRQAGYYPISKHRLLLTFI